LVACLARARGEPPGPALERWHAGLAEHPTRSIALAGNEWILARLRA
jgi:hypothetical protein